MAVIDFHISPQQGSRLEGNVALPDQEYSSLF